MNTYELTVVLPGDYTPAKVKASKAQIEKIVKTMQGEIKKSDDWGIVELAYKIGKHKTGNFVHFLLELEASAVKAISDKLNMEDGVLRFLVVRK